MSRLDYAIGFTLGTIVGFGWGTYAKADPCTAPLPTVEGTIFTGQVNYVIDGDSICVNNIEVRLADFDAPELNTKEGQKAKLIAQLKWTNQFVTCRVTMGRNGHTTSYDRVIAVCH